jgi:hypothetical protein
VRSVLFAGNEETEAAVTTDSEATEMALAGCGESTHNTNTIILDNIARDECEQHRPSGKHHKGLRLKQASTTETWVFCWVAEDTSIP